ncbi:hypothetical protein MLC52_06990 [Sulfurimonas sp. NW15]|uniref:hypothetical protein n=1 Tax=Sulfurimonas sp. NW15 TaxID=2922729 RepID=UPI003DA98636
MQQAHISNEPQRWDHMKGAIYSRSRGSNLIYKTPLELKDGSIIFNDEDTYITDYNESFTLKGNIFTYRGLSIALPVNRNITPIQRIYMALGYSFDKHSDYDIDIEEVDFKSLLHVLTMMALRDEKFLRGNFTQHKQLRYGEHIFEAYVKAVSGSGNIKAKNKHIRWLNEQDTLQLKTKLFDTANYQAGVHSMKYTPTVIMDKIITKVYKYVKLLKFKEHSVKLQPLDFKFNLSKIDKIRMRDALLLLNNSIGFSDGSFIIRPTLQDTQHSRVYSVFTSISSDTRKLLGFTNYDIGSALQTICLQLVDNPKNFPLHKELADNKVAFRTKVMSETDMDMEWVKKELSKIDNLDNMPKKYKLYPTLEAYYKEALKLRVEILDNTEELTYSRAHEYAKPNWKAIWKVGKKEPDFVEDGKKEVSIFFFIWTQYEREIREAMMSCFSTPEACHQVHDAVYSKEDIDSKIIEDYVLDQTGFEVKISKN